MITTYCLSNVKTFLFGGYLVGGVVEDGESLAQAAIRETQEETRSVPRGEAARLLIV